MGAGRQVMGSGLQAGHWVRLREQIARMTRRQDAEDLLHDAWIGMTRRQQMKGNADAHGAGDGGRAAIVDPAAYLARAATNRARDVSRRERRTGEGLPLDVVEGTLAHGDPLQDEALIARHRLERLRKGIEHLSPRTRQIFLLHRLEGRKYREIAHDLGISQSAVEKHIAKAMEQLAVWMETW
ncbi:sigma-70 family RNA polymerase sigma factor (plasmid) [Croceibacterium sp. TMG7-5b_MA50]|uniref:RNA polymerase sigma factor n=1 Tax=Croceibacterium sp. TMG7-5b_MA50 TaxID=3121290 RepID=UPI0032221281